MMFGTIMISGIQMLAKTGFSQRNVTIAALSLAVGIGFTSTSEVEIWNIFPQIVKDVFSANCVAVVFVVAIILSLILPKNMEIEKNQWVTGNWNAFRASGESKLQMSALWNL